MLNATPPILNSRAPNSSLEENTFPSDGQSSTSVTRVAPPTAKPRAMRMPPATTKGSM